MFMSYHVPTAHARRSLMRLWVECPAVSRRRDANAPGVPTVRCIEALESAVVQKVRGRPASISVLFLAAPDSLGVGIVGEPAEDRPRSFPPSLYARKPMRRAGDPNRRGGRDRPGAVSGARQGGIPARMAGLPGVRMWTRRPAPPLAVVPGLVRAAAPHDPGRLARHDGPHAPGRRSRGNADGDPRATRLRSRLRREHV